MTELQKKKERRQLGVQKPKHSLIIENDMFIAPHKLKQHENMHMH
jgi:hypothetical protein